MQPEVAGRTDVVGPTRQLFGPPKNRQSRRIRFNTAAAQHFDFGSVECRVLNAADWTQSSSHNVLCSLPRVVRIGADNFPILITQCGGFVRSAGKLPILNSLASFTVTRMYQSGICHHVKIASFCAVFFYSRRSSPPSGMRSAESSWRNNACIFCSSLILLLLTMWNFSTSEQGYSRRDPRSRAENLNTVSSTSARRFGAVVSAPPSIVRSSELWLF